MPNMSLFLDAQIEELKSSSLDMLMIRISTEIQLKNI